MTISLETRTRAEHAIAISQAVLTGQRVQCHIYSNESWKDIADGTEIWAVRNPDMCRVKPEPRVVPWDEATCPKVFVMRKKIGPFRSRSAIKQDEYTHIRYWTSDDDHNSTVVTFHDLLRDWVRVKEDGSEWPCGVEVTE